MLKIPTNCPICGKPTYAAVVKCEECGTAINNKFTFSVFEKLTAEQSEFVLAFIDCDGSIKDMEKRFGISYPTVKSRLAEIKAVLGITDGKANRKSAIKQLEKGKIDVEEAIKKLKGRE